MESLPKNDAGAGNPLIVRTEGPVMIMTINRPRVCNAINLEVATAIESALVDFDSRPELRVGIIGAGRNFSAGMDLKAFANGQRRSTSRGGFAGLTERPPVKPLIAAVERYALAAGFEVTLACDLVVASSSATFGLPETKRGRVAAAGGPLRFPRPIPHRIATELALLGDSLGAQRAHDLGLVNRTTGEGQALTGALELARQLGANGPLALQDTKRILNEARDWTLVDQFARQRTIAEPVFASADAAEAARAFAERRKPHWTGS